MSFLSHMCDSHFILASDNSTVTAISSGSAAVCSPRSGDPTYPGPPSLVLLLAQMLSSSLSFLRVPGPVCVLSPGMLLCLLLSPTSICAPVFSSTAVPSWLALPYSTYSRAVFFLLLEVLIYSATQFAVSCCLLFLVISCVSLIRKHTSGRSYVLKH